MLEEKDIQLIEDRVSKKVVQALEPKFEFIEKRLVKLETQMSAVLLRVEAIEKDIEDIKYCQYSMKEDLKRVKDDLQTLTKTENEDVTAAYKDVGELKQRVQALETQMISLQT